MKLRELSDRFARGEYNNEIKAAVTTLLGVLIRDGQGDAELTELFADADKAHARRDRVVSDAQSAAYERGKVDARAEAAAQLAPPPADAPLNSMTRGPDPVLGAAPVVSQDAPPVDTPTNEDDEKGSEDVSDKPLAEKLKAGEE